MSDTIGIEEELKKRISDIIGKDITVRQLGKIVELFSSEEVNEDEIWNSLLMNAVSFSGGAYIPVNAIHVLRGKVSIKIK